MVISDYGLRMTDGKQLANSSISQFANAITLFAPAINRAPISAPLALGRGAGGEGTANQRETGNVKRETAKLPTANRQLNSVNYKYINC